GASAADGALGAGSAVVATSTADPAGVSAWSLTGASGAAIWAAAASCRVTSASGASAVFWASAGSAGIALTTSSAPVASSTGPFSPSLDRYARRGRGRAAVRRAHSAGWVLGGSACRTRTTRRRRSPLARWRAAPLVVWAKAALLLAAKAALLLAANAALLLAANAAASPKSVPAWAPASAGSARRRDGTAPTARGWRRCWTFQ